MTPEKQQALQEHIQAIAKTHIPHFNLKHEEITVKRKAKRAGKLSSKYS